MINASYPPVPISAEEWQVISILSELHPRKAPRQDELKGSSLTQCAAQLGGVVAELQPVPSL